MRAIEVAHHMNWSNLWLESDSQLVVSAFKNLDKLVSWAIRNRWQNVLAWTRQMNFVVSHTYREGNVIADLLANHGLNLSSIFFWHEAPFLIREELSRNKLGLSNFRVVSC
jgi:ribonuclease HI